jgi:DNA-binding transcriptional LysR family regulator
MLAAALAVAQTKTLEKAAIEVGVGTASAIYKRIQSLTQLLGEPLFLNTEEGMALTEAGQAFYPDALRAVELALLAEERVTALVNIKAGRLLVGHSTYLPPKLLSAILNLSFDDMQIEHISSLTQSVVQRVTEGTLHAGFGYLPVAHPDLLTRVLFEEPLMVCLRANHPLAQRAFLRPVELESEPVIAIGREPLPEMHSEIESYFAGFGIELRIVADAFGVTEAVSLVEQGAGICFAGGTSISRPGVVVKPLSPQTITRKCGIFVREDNRHSLIESFVDSTVRKIGVPPLPGSAQLKK